VRATGSHERAAAAAGDGASRRTADELQELAPLDRLMNPPRPPHEGLLAVAPRSGAARSA